MGKRNHSRPRHPFFTPLSSQKREGSKLKGPLSALTPKVQAVDWLRDLVPEHWWLASLADKFGLDRAAAVYNAFMDAVDAHWSHNFVALGLISDFGLVPSAERAPFLQKNREMIDECFHRPIGRVLSLYPDGPAAWLIRRD